MAEKSLKKNAAYNFIRAFLNLAFPIISFPYASRILMPSGIGKVNFINSLIDYFILLAGLGIGTYAAREAARIRDDKEALNEFCHQILSINLVSTLVSYCALLVAFCLSSKLQSYKVLLLVISTKILFSSIGMEWLYTAEEEYKYITLRSASFQVVSLLFLFTFVKKPEDYVLYALMGVLSNVGSNICNFIHARKFVTIRLTRKINLKKHFKPILVFFGTSCASKIHNALDTVMIGFMLTDIAVGYYSAAQKIQVLVRRMITSMLSTLMPRSAWYLEHGSTKEYQGIIQKAGNASFFFSIPASFGLMVIARPLIILFSGDAYLPALSSMLVLAPVIITSSLASFLSNVILTPRRLEKYSLQAEVVGATLNFVLNFLLIPVWGVFGASLATMIVEFSLMLVLLVHAWKYLKGSKLLISFLQALLGAAVMALMVSLSIGFFTSPFLQIVVGMAVGAATYAIVMLLMHNQSALMVLGILKKRLHK